MFYTFLAFLFTGFVSFFIKETVFFQQNINYLSWGFVLLCSLVFLVENRLRSENPVISLILALGYMARLGIMFWDIYFKHIFNLVHSGNDTEVFFHTAVYLSTGYRAPNQLIHATLYAEWLADFFLLWGPQRIMAQYPNILLAMLCTLIILRIAKSYHSTAKVQYILLTLCMFIPNQLFLNSILVRESIIMFFGTMSLYFFYLWFHRAYKWAIPFAFIFVYLAANHHEGMIGLALGYAFCLFFYNRTKKKFVVSPITLVIAPIGIFIFLLVGETVSQSIGLMDIEGASSLIHEATRVSDIGHARTQYTALIRTGNYELDVILSTPLRIVYFLFSPMPWHWNSVMDPVAFILNSVMYIYIYVVVIRTLLKKDLPNKELIWMVFIVTLAGVATFSWGVSNSGTAMRHRDKFFPLHILMFSLCYQTNTIKDKFAQYLNVSL